MTIPKQRSNAFLLLWLLLLVLPDLSASSSPTLSPSLIVPNPTQQQPRRSQALNNDDKDVSADTTNATSTVLDKRQAKDDGNALQYNPLSNHTTSASALPKKKKLKKQKQKTKSTTRVKATLPTTTKSKSDTVRRIQREWKDLIDAGMGYDWGRQRPITRKQKPSSMNGTEIQPRDVWIGPLHRSNLLVWHFSFLGLPGSPYEGGVYHGRLQLPKTYPKAPPKVQVWTPSGRFVVRHNVCLSASHYHPECWNAAAWTLRTLTQSLRLHMLTTGHEIGGLAHVPLEQKVQYAQDSRSWRATLSERRGIVADHAHMIQQGLFPTTTENNNAQNESNRPSNKDPNDDNEEARSAKLARFMDDDDLLDLYYESIVRQDKEVQTGRTVVRSRRKTAKSATTLSSSLFRLFHSPVRLALWGFLILFVWLNLP